MPDRPTFEPREVDISDLLFDLENPRIYLGSPTSQKQALEEILRLHGNHTFALAKHLAKWGQLDEPVITDANEEGKYVVKEGNRRLAAIKLLKNPELAGSKWQKHFSRLKKEANISDNDFTRLKCRYSDNADLIEEYMNVRHGGVLGGVGTVPWTPLNKAMDKLKNGAKDKEARAAAAIRYASKLNCFPFDESYPITTLVRFFTLENMKKLGINDIFSNPPDLAVDENTVKERLCYIIKEIGKDGDKDSRKLSSTAERNKWLDEILQKFPTDVIAKSADIKQQDDHEQAPLPANLILHPQQDTDRQQTGSTTRKRNADPYSRKYIFTPKEKYGVDLGEAGEKTKAFYKEMANLDVERFPMLAAMGLRAFLELSTAHCEKKLGITPKKGAHLPDRVKTCANKMWGADDARTKAIANTVSSGSYLSLKALNEVMHNEHYPTTKKEVFAIWTKLRPYIASCFE